MAELIVPLELYQELKAGHVVLFVGAGISTESGPHGAPSFAQRIASEIGGRAKPGMPFPDLMQLYCDVTDGGQRHRLTRQIIERIEAFSEPSERNALATWILRELARIPQINRIVTTNWDPFIERVFNILVPMVEDRDVSFWDDRHRQVLKIHGCVTRPYTIVATRDDYGKCVRRSPLIFNKLRDLLATKTIMFLGFSMRDPDFSLIFDQITKKLGGFRRLCYAFDPAATEEMAASFRRRKVRLIAAGGMAVARELIDLLVRDDLILSSAYCDYIKGQWERVSGAHLRRKQTSIGAVLSAMYQDGLMHALGGIGVAADLGRSRDWFEAKLKGAQSSMARHQKRRNEIEIAYWSGQLLVFEKCRVRGLGDIPLYFDPIRLVPTARFLAGSRLPRFDGVLDHLDKDGSG